MLTPFRSLKSALALLALGLTPALEAQPAIPTPAAPAGTAQPPPGGVARGPGGTRGGQRAGNSGPAADTLPFVTQPALGGMAFENPVAIVTAPGEPNRLYVVEKPGRIIVIPDVSKPERVTFLDITAKVGQSGGEMGLLALAFHPDYRRNRQFYLWFTLNATTAAGTGRHNRLARFTASATDPNKGDPASEQPLLTQFDQAANHNGGEIQFGPDGYLYLTVGDEGGANDQFQNSQRIDRDYFAAMLRIDVDKRPGSLVPNSHPAVHEGSYTVPPDNPWVGATVFNQAPVDPAQVRTEFWAVGLRNAWRFAFDPETKLLWLADIGQDRIEEITLIRRGGNNGWNYREGHEFFYPNAFGRGSNNASTPPQPYRVTPEGLTFDEPVFAYYHPGTGATAGEVNLGTSVTGGFVYRGRALPALRERYLFADYQNGLIWALGPVQPGGVNGLASKPDVRLVARRSGIASFGLDPVTGDLLVANVSNNLVERLVPNPAPVPAVSPVPAP